MAESKVEVHVGSSEWSAVYLDGKLQRVGDHYLAEEWLRDHFGVTEVYSDDFMMGGNDREHVAETVAQVTEYREMREAREAHAARLREEAARLVAEAEELTRGG